jgi:hypothetical protein
LLPPGSLKSKIKVIFGFSDPKNIRVQIFISKQAKFLFNSAFWPKSTTVAVEGFHTKGWTKFFIVDFVNFYGQNNFINDLE